MILLFEVGWIVYTGGFGSYMHQSVLQFENANRLDSSYPTYRQSTSAPDANKVLRDPQLFSHYFALVGGQFIAILFLLQAVLPSCSIASYVVSVLSSILNIIYFVSVGYLIHWSVDLVRSYEESVRTLSQESPSPSYTYYPGSSTSSEDLKRAILYLHAVRCILGGTVIMSISWGVIQLLIFFYKSQIDSPHNQRNLWQVVRELITDLPTSTSQIKAKLGELIRLSIIPLLVLSAVGWSVCTAGLYKLSVDNARITSTPRYDFGTWTTFFVTPFLYFAVLFHAGCSGGASTMSGVFAAIFNVFFVLSMGGTVVIICVFKYTLDQLDTTTLAAGTLQDIYYHSDLVLGGGVVCLIFWTIIYTAWHFYHFDRSTDHARMESSGDNAYEHSRALPVTPAQQNDTTTVPVTHTGFIPEQPHYAKHLEAEMQPVIN